MNRLQRGPWVALTESGWILCAFCWYRDPEDDGYRCRHLLEAVADRFGDNMEPTDDCWGFRPGPGDTVEAAATRLTVWQAEDAARERTGM